MGQDRRRRNVPSTVIRGIRSKSSTASAPRSGSWPPPDHQPRQARRLRTKPPPTSRPSSRRRPRLTVCTRSAGDVRSAMASSGTPPERSKIPTNPTVRCLPQLKPRSGHVKHLPTRAEAQSLLTLADAYVLEVPVKAANNVLTAVDQAVEKDKSITLSHLRRFARENNLPRYVRDRLRIVRPQGINDLIKPLKVIDLNKSEACDQDKVNGEPEGGEETKESLFLLIGLTRLITLESIQAIISEHSINNEVLRTRVPISPPMNSTLAREWTELYWPCVYRKSTPLGPHPNVIRQGMDAVIPYSGYWMAQVIEIAKEGRAKHMGPAIAALVVDGKGPLAPAPIAIAADARYGIEHDQVCGTDNIMNHAVMRVIGLVGRKRMSLATPPRESPRNNIVLDYPILETEKHVLAGDILPPGGYLCTGLDIYLTHEPCIMCAQAILHSRFDKVIFRRRMSKTGAATPERPGDGNAGLGYGLFWRPELNWRLLAWEWNDDPREVNDNIDEDGVMPLMHA